MIFIVIQSSCQDGALACPLHMIVKDLEVVNSHNKRCFTLRCLICSQGTYTNKNSRTQHRPPRSLVANLHFCIVESEGSGSMFLSRDLGPSPRPKNGASFRVHSLILRLPVRILHGMRFTIPLINMLLPIDDLMKAWFKDERLRALFTFQTLYVGLTPYNSPGRQVAGII